MKISKLLYSGWLAKISYMFGIALILASLAINAIPAKTVSACWGEIQLGTVQCLNGNVTANLM